MFQNKKCRDLNYLADFADCVHVQDLGELFAKFTTAKSVFDILFDGKKATINNDIAAIFLFELINPV